MSKQQKLIIGLGSNLGNRKQNLSNAINVLEETFNCSSISSPIYQTEAWGFESETLFLNCCVIIHSDLAPKEILKATQKIEKRLGRVKKSKNNKYQSRIIDIDILYYGTIILKTKTLTIPHPLIYTRAFVLEPLSEICPSFVDPLKNQTIAELNWVCNDK